MAIDRSDFLILVTTLAAGGAGGWYFRDRTQPPPPPPPARLAAPPPPPSAAPTATGPVPVTLLDTRTADAPACDDSQGKPEQCPSVGPSDEGMCPNVIYKRCQDFKTAFKPRVAEKAVACLRALKPNERCDPARINLCGHLALMSACPEPVAAPKAQLQSSDGKEPTTVTLAVDATAPASPVATACQSVLKACENQPLAPTLADCRQTLAGLNDVGRASMVQCVSQHCSDRGLYACEALPLGAK